MDRDAFTAELARVASATGVPVPDRPYVTGITRCWTCGTEMLAFAWPDGGDTIGTPWAATPPPEPKPETVRVVDTLIPGTYWGNACPSCGETQGDWFLHYRDDGPFYPLGGGVTEDWEADQAAVAAWHDDAGRQA